jgi:hypothetical protein
MESPENDKTVFRPSHKPWKSIKPIPTFPPPRQPRDIYENIPKRSRPKLPASNTPFRLILGLEKTPPCEQKPLKLFLFHEAIFDCRGMEKCAVDDP